MFLITLFLRVSFGLSSELAHTQKHTHTNTPNVASIEWNWPRITSIPSIVIRQFVVMCHWASPVRSGKHVANAA